MKNLTDTEMSLLNGCQSADDWSNACDKIKKARGGEYPEDWWDKVKLSGMMDRILARWGSDSSLKGYFPQDSRLKFMTDGKHRGE